MHNLTEAVNKANASTDRPGHISEIRNLMAKDYLKKRDQKIQEGIKKFDGDFYIQMMFLRDKTMKHGKVFRTIGRACRGVASPVCHSHMWKYHRHSGYLELLWSIPSMDECMYMLHNKHLVHPQEYDLLKYVIAFADGSLDRLCDAENEKVAERLNKQ